MMMLIMITEPINIAITLTIITIIIMILLYVAIELQDGLLQLTLAEEDKLSKKSIEINTTKDRIMSAFREIEEQEILKNKPDKIDPDAPPKDPNLPKEPKVLPPLQGLALEGYEKVKEMLDLSKEKKSRMDAKLRQMVEKKNIQLEQLSKLFMQRVHVNPTDFKRFFTLPSFVKTTVRVATLAQMQAMVSYAIIDKGMYLDNDGGDDDVDKLLPLPLSQSGT